MTTAELVDEIKVSLPSRQKVSRLETNALAKKDEATQIKVRNAGEYNAAAEFALTIKEMELSVGELYDPHVKDAHLLHKNLTTARGRLLKPLEEARKVVQAEMSAYDLKQRKLAQAKAEEEAKKERALAIKEAAKAKDNELVKELKAAPIIAAPIDVPTPRVSRVVSKSIVKWRILDEKKVPRSFLCLDEQKISAFVKQYGISAEIAGIEVYEDVQTQIRG